MTHTRARAPKPAAPTVAAPAGVTRLMWILRSGAGGAVVVATAGGLLGWVSMASVRARRRAGPRPADDDRRDRVDPDRQHEQRHPGGHEGGDLRRAGVEDVVGD